MIRGRMPNSARAVIPYIYVDPVIAFDVEGKLDLDFIKALTDIWKNYNVNIRYLHVVHDSETTDKARERIEKQFQKKLEGHMFNFELIHEFDLLEHIRPDNVICFFGERERLQSNSKVYGKISLLRDYSLLLSACRNERQVSVSSNRYRRRRGDI